jgi:uncharacterized membrane protein YphA (DoxX/SURF4 family)
MDLIASFLDGTRLQLALLANPSWLAPSSLLLNAWAIALLIFGLVMTIRKPQPQADLADKVIHFGPMFYSIPLAFFGMQHFALFDQVKPAVPAYMPWPAFWTCFVGAALIAACLSILTGIKADIAALSLAAMFILFELMLHVPNLIQNPHDRFSISGPLRDLSLCCGAMCLAWTMSPASRKPRLRWLAVAGRWLFTATILYFGVEQFLHPEFAPGVPLEMLMPAWFPAHVACAWFAGIVLVVSGLCMAANKYARWAATAVGFAYVLLVVFVYIPMEIVHPSVDVSGELDYVANTLAVGGAALLVAATLTKRLN